MRRIQRQFFCMGCPDFRGRSESSFHLARELVSGVRPVKATVTGSQAGPARWNAPPDSEPDRHRQQANHDQASRSSWGRTKQRLSWKVTMRGCQESTAATVNFRRIINTLGTTCCLLESRQHGHDGIHHSPTARPIPHRSAHQRQTQECGLRMHHGSARGSQLLVMVHTPGPKFTPGPARPQWLG